MPDTRSSRISLSHEVQLDSTVAAVFLERALEQGLGEIRTGDWPTSAASLVDLGPSSMHLKGKRHESSLYEWDGALVLVSRYANHIHAFAAAGSRDGLDLILARLQAALPPPDPSSKHEVTVRFWTYGRHGPQQSWRSIGVPEWEEISGNYGGATRPGLEAMMRGFRPAHGGQLLLWHGTAGTGKTFALRALAWEWRGWCEFHYIVDPDTFFGEHADYLMSVLMEEGSEIVRMQRAMESAAAGLAMGWTSYGADGDEAADEESAGRAWRVLVLEDTGELLSAEARVAVGQGLRVLVLVTTNEELKSLHPAVARPGRAAANVHFGPLSAEEAGEWLGRHGTGRRVEEPMTLASLYAEAEGREASAITLAEFGDTGV